MSCMEHTCMECGEMVFNNETRCTCPKCGGQMSHHWDEENDYDRNEPDDFEEFNRNEADDYRDEGAENVDRDYYEDEAEEGLDESTE